MVRRVAVLARFRASTRRGNRYRQWADVVDHLLAFGLETYGVAVICNRRTDTAARGTAAYDRTNQ